MNTRNKDWYGRKNGRCERGEVGGKCRVHFECCIEWNHWNGSTLIEIHDASGDGECYHDYSCAGLGPSDRQKKLFYAN